MKRSKIAASMVAGAVLAAWGTEPARAALVYNYFTPQTSYSLEVGTSVDVPVYLQEAGDTPSVLAAQNGLASASVRVSETTLVAGGVAISAVVPNSAFDDIASVTPDLSGGSARDVLLYETTVDPLFAVGTPPTHGVVATETPAGSGIYQVLLGVFHFSANNLGDATYLLAASDSSDDIYTFDVLYGATPGTAISPVSALQLSFEVTAVPETGWAGLVLVPAVGLLRRARRR